ncbi:MAG: filamentous hemagglutinin N-terminal domain-containing protein, partial [Candidatus Pacebacteria bacterium]|nr:filamentous hemagglutinin N-terminal domain-containing protein [Candidatus Paceibacterota bacterium]
ISTQAIYRKSSLAKYSGLLATTCMVGMTLANHNAKAAPTGGNVVGGNASITVAGTATNINQTTARAAIDWHSFSVAANESVNFTVPNGGATLNRVTGGSQSLIQGSISSNGTLYLVNPNGLVFAVGSSVSAKNFIASTSNIDPTEFMRGDHITFGTSNKNARISLNGTITVADRGIVGIFAPQVANAGIITANLGSVTLAGVQSSTIDFTGDGLINFELGTSTEHKDESLLASNKGIIAAAGGHVTLTAEGANELFNAVVEHSGSINVNSLTAQGGTVTIKANKGNIINSGTIQASGTQGGGNVMVFADGNTNYTGDVQANALAGGDKPSDGGQVEVSGKQTIQFMGNVSTHSFNGGRLGSLLIDPTNVVIVATAPASGTALSLSSNAYTTNGTDNNSYVLVSNLVDALRSNNVTVDATTTGAGTGVGSITVSDAIEWSGTGNLTLKSKDAITINGAIKSTKSGTLANLTLDSSAGSGGITITKDITAAEVTLKSGAGITGGTVASGASFATVGTGLVNATTLNITANSGAGGGVTLYGAIAKIGGITRTYQAGGGDTLITSSQAFTVTGAINQGNNNLILVTTNGDMTLSKDVTSGNLVLNSAGKIIGGTTSGNGLISTGVLNVTAADDVTLSGAINYLNDLVINGNTKRIIITGSNGIVITNRLNIGSSDLTMTAAGTNNIFFSQSAVDGGYNSLTTTGTVTLISGGAIHGKNGANVFNAPITASSLTVTANGLVNIGGGAIGKLAGFTQNATTGTNNVSIGSTSNMIVETNIINKTGEVNLSSGNLTSVGNLSVTGTRIIDSGTNAVNITATGTFTVADTNKLIFQSNAAANSTTANSTAAITIRAGGYALTGVLNGTTRVALDIGAGTAKLIYTGLLDTSTGTGVTTGDIVVGGAAAIAVSPSTPVFATLGLTGTAKANGGLAGGQNVFTYGAAVGLVDLTKVATSTVGRANITEIDNFSGVKGRANVYIAGVGTAPVAASGGNAAVAAISSEIKTITAGATGKVIFGTADSYFDEVKINAGTTITTTTGAVGTAGMIIANKVGLSANGAITIAGAIDSINAFTQGATGGDVTITSSKRLEINAAMNNAGKKITLDTSGATGQSIVLYKDITGSDVTLKSSGAITTAATNPTDTGKGLVNATNVSLTTVDIAAITVHGSYAKITELRGGKLSNVNLRSSKALTLDNMATAYAASGGGGTLDIGTSDGGITINQAVSYDRLTVTSAGAISFTKDVNPSTLSMSAGSTITSGTTAGTGLVNAGTLTITGAAGNVSLTGAIVNISGISQSAGSLSISSSNGGDLNNIALTLTGGTTINNGDRAVTLATTAAGQGMVIAGSINPSITAGTLTINSSGIVHRASADEFIITAAKVKVTAKGSVWLKGAIGELETYTQNGNTGNLSLTIKSTVPLTITPAINQPALGTGGTGVTNNDVSITTTGANNGVTLKAAITTGGTLAINSAAGITAQAAISGNAVNITAAGPVNLAGLTLGANSTFDNTGSNPFTVTSTGEFKISAGTLTFKTNNTANTSSAVVNLLASSFTITPVSDAIDVGAATLNAGTIVDANRDIIVMGSGVSLNYASLGFTQPFSAVPSGTGQNVFTFGGLAAIASTKIKSGSTAVNNSAIYKSTGSIYVAGVGVAGTRASVASINSTNGKVIFGTQDSFFGSDLTVSGKDGIVINNAIDATGKTVTLNNATSGGVSGTAKIIATTLKGNVAGTATLTTNITNLGDFTMNPTGTGASAVPSNFTLTNDVGLNVTGTLSVVGGATSLTTVAPSGVGSYASITEGLNSTGKILTRDLTVNANSGGTGEGGQITLTNPDNVVTGTFKATAALGSGTTALN